MIEVHVAKIQYGARAKGLFGLLWSSSEGAPLRGLSKRRFAACRSGASQPVEAMLHSLSKRRFAACRNDASRPVGASLPRRAEVLLNELHLPDSEMLPSVELLAARIQADMQFGTAVNPGPEPPHGGPRGGIGEIGQGQFGSFHRTNGVKSDNGWKSENRERPSENRKMVPGQSGEEVSK